MFEREAKMPLRSWQKPEFRRIDIGAAQAGGDTSSDGSGTLS